MTIAQAYKDIERKEKAIKSNIAHAQDVIDLMTASKAKSEEQLLKLYEAKKLIDNEFNNLKNIYDTRTKSNAVSS